jgi:hypothetical protein
MASNKKDLNLDSNKKTSRLNQVDWGGGVCKTIGTSLSGEVKLLVHELATHVLVG